MKKNRDAHVYNRNELRHDKNKKVEFDKNHDKRSCNTGFNKDYQLFAACLQRQPRYEWTREVACQCYIGKNMKGYCSPKREQVVYYSGLPRQVYAYSRTRSYTDVGVGSVMLQQKKRVRKIYLPETENRGVGSEDLASFITADRRPRYGRENGYFRYGREDYSRYPKFPKKTSKCVGGAVENIKKCSEKLSPIICYNKSKGTSPNEIEEEKRISKDTANNTINKNMANNTTQVESTYEKTKSFSNQMKKDPDYIKEMEPKNKVKSVKSPIKKLPDNAAVQKSSDSLEQHVHNLEDPSFIPSTGSSDPMENKLEKEYRKIFSNKNKDDKANTEKTINDMKSTSALRRRFEALKRGIAKKDDAKKNAPTASKESNPAGESSAMQSSGTVQSSTVENTPIHVDISVESDPPSLEARSYSHTKFSPATSAYKYDRKTRNPSRKKSHTGKKEKESVQWSPPDKTKADESDVQGMFKVWGEKFDLEQGKSPQTGVSYDRKAKEPGIQIKEDEPKPESQEKKEGKRFFFFKKKSKDKTKSPCKSKKGVTAGRCEVKNCLITPTPAPAKPQHPPKEKPKIVPKKSEETDEILKKTWLQKFIQRTIESRKSLQIRWNNKTYTTSSSTVFELMDNVYRQTEIIIRSQSETSTAASSYYHSYHRHHVNFVQDIEAWMVPQLIQESEIPYRFHRKDHQTTIPDRKWFIDKSKAFAHKIELVLHSKNFVKCHRVPSSEYLRIDIPKDFFTDLSSDSDRFATSNSEEVYKIVEYESTESRSDLKFKVKNDIGDHLDDSAKITQKLSVRDKNIDTRVTETVIKKPPVHRDVVIQGSNVHIPKRCDVIGVGIITHRDIRELRKPIMKIEDDVSEEESEHAVDKSIKSRQCEFAESYLREYYRNWMPLGIDLFPSRASDVYVKCESAETLSSNNNQGDGSKSCPNLKDYQSPENLNPASSSSYPYKDINTDKVKIFNTFKSLTQSTPPLDTKRVLPKDSFEVLKKRMMYAYGNKAKWVYADDDPYSVPSLQDKAEQDAMQEIPESVCNKNKKCRKHVSITNCDYPSGDNPIPVIHIPPIKKDAKPLAGILSFCKKNTSDTKHATVREDINCEIPPAPCKEYCTSAKNPKCSQQKPRPNPKPSSKNTSTESSSSSQISCQPPPCPPSPCPPPPCPPPPCLPSPSPPPPSPIPKNNDPSPPEPPRQESRALPKNKYPSQQEPRQVSQNVCSCTCTPKMSSPLISPTDSPVTSPDITLLHTASPITVSVKLTSCQSKPCPCSPEYDQLKNQKRPQPPKPCTCAPKETKRNKKEKMCPASSHNTNKSPPRSQQSVKPPTVIDSPTTLPPKAPCFSPKQQSMSPPPPKSPCFSPKQQNMSPPPPKSPCFSPRQQSMSSPPPKSPCCSTKQSSCTPSSCSEQSSENVPCPCKTSPKNSKRAQKSGCSQKSCNTPNKTQTTCSECFQKSFHSQSSDTCERNQSPDRSPQQSLSQCSSKSTQYEENSPDICPGSPCPTRLEDLTKKAKSMPKMQGLHLRMKPNPPPPKCVGDCPAVQKKKCPVKEDTKKKCPEAENEKNSNPCNSDSSSNSSNDKECLESPSDIKCLPDENIMTRVKKMSTEEIRVKCLPDENMMIRVKKMTDSTEEIREGVNVKVKDADGRTLYERRDYKTDCNRETHRPPVLGEVFKVNRLSTESIETGKKLPTKDDNNESTKSEASIANMIEISFGLKVTQGDKITEINLTDDKDEELDDSQIKCKLNKSQDIFMVDGEADPTTDEPNDKNDINIKIVIKNFKSKSEKSSKKQKNNDYFSKKISQKFHTVSTGYSDVLQDQIDNIYSIHRTTVDLSSSKSQLQDKIGDVEHSETNTDNIQSKEGIPVKLSQKEIEYSITGTCEEIKNLQVDKEIKKSVENTSLLETYETMKKSQCNGSVNRISSCADLKSNRSETTLENYQDIEKTETISNIPKSDTYPILQTSKTRETIHNSELDEVIHKSIDKMPRTETCEVAQITETNEKKSETSQRIQIIKNYLDNPINLRFNPIIKKSIRNTETSDIKINSKFENDAKKPDKTKNETNNTTKRTEISEIIENKDYVEVIQKTENYETIAEKKVQEQNECCCEIRTIRKSEILVSRSETEERIRSIENYESISNKSSHIDKIESSEPIQNPVIEETIQTTNTCTNDVLISETIQIVENWQSLSALEEIKIGDEKPILEEKKYQTSENERQKVTNEIHEEIKKFENFLKMQKRFQFPIDFHKPVEITADIDNSKEIEIIDTTIVTKAELKTDITKDECNTEPDRERKVTKPELNIECSETILSHTDTDDQDNTVDLTNTSEDCDKTIFKTRPHTKREKKDMLKHVFEKATTQKWKTKGRMKRLRNMLKFILTSDSSEVEEIAETSKDLMKEITCFNPNNFKYTDSLTNYYVENALQSDDDNKLTESHPTQDQSEDDICSDSSDYHPKVSKCKCNSMAERIKKRGDKLLTGCCCRIAPVKVHEQTSCDMNTDKGLCINCKGAEYIDVQTQNSIFNSEIRNVTLMTKMESVMTSKTSSDFESLRINTTVSPYRDDKQCEAKNTNTMLGLIDNGKIVIRTSDENKLSLQTEIVIGWKGKEKQKKKERRNTYFASPSDILQSYETKKAVLEIYTEKTVSEEGERLVAKLPKFVYEKEEEIEENYVKNVLLAHKG